MRPNPGKIRDRRGGLAGARRHGLPKDCRRSRCRSEECCRQKEKPPDPHDLHPVSVHFLRFSLSLAARCTPREQVLVLARRTWLQVVLEVLERRLDFDHKPSPMTSTSTRNAIWSNGSSTKSSIFVALQRYEKTALSFASMLFLVGAMIWLR